MDRLNAAILNAELKLFLEAELNWLDELPPPMPIIQPKGDPRGRSEEQLHGKINTQPKPSHEQSMDRPVTEPHT